MKKTISLFLALLLACSVFTVAMAKEDHRFNFGWEKPGFDFDYDFGFDFNDGHKEDHQPATPSDVPNPDDNHQGKPENKPNQGRPENPAQRPEGSTCNPGDPNCPDRVTNTDTPDTPETNDITNIFDLILLLKDKGFHGGNFHMPKNNGKFFVVGMIINENGTIEFIYVEKGKEDKGEQRLPCHKDDVTGTDVTETDVTGTDIPEGMEFITMGDTDVDGFVNAKDALKILKHAVKKAVMEHEGQQFLADMNEDGVIDAKDALHVLRKAVGKK